MASRFNVRSARNSLRRPQIHPRAVGKLTSVTICRELKHSDQTITSEHGGTDRRRKNRLLFASCKLVGSRSMGLNLHLLGEFTAAARSFERVLELYNPNEHGALTAVAAFDMRALALSRALHSPRGNHTGRFCAAASANTSSVMASHAFREFWRSFRDVDPGLSALAPQLHLRLHRSSCRRASRR